MTIRIPTNMIETINTLVRTSRQMLLEIGGDLDECAIEILPRI